MPNENKQVSQYGFKTEMSKKAKENFSGKDPYRNLSPAEFVDLVIRRTKDPKRAAKKK